MKEESKLLNSFNVFGVRIHMKNTTFISLRQSLSTKLLTQ